MTNMKTALISGLALAAGAFAVALPLHAQENRTVSPSAKMDHGSMQMGHSMLPAEMAQMKEMMGRMEKMMAHCEGMMKDKATSKALGSSQGQGAPKR